MLYEIRKGKDDYGGDGVGWDGMEWGGVVVVVAEKMEPESGS